MQNKSVPNELPAKQGLYDPQFEKDACGVAGLVQIEGIKEHNIITKCLTMLNNLEHRGGSHSASGDGAGIMMQVPHDFLKQELSKENITLPEENEYALGMFFLPKEEKLIEAYQRAITDLVVKADYTILAWRKVPTDSSSLSSHLLASEPSVFQLFIKPNTNTVTDTEMDSFERNVYILRRIIENYVRRSSLEQKNLFYICSFSPNTVTYKGMFLSYQLEEYFPDLKNQDFTTAMALVHQRYSTNTFPTWKLAQPFRIIAHNGEFNTISGNTIWTKAKEKLLSSGFFGDSLKDILPILQEGNSDSASFDNLFELIYFSGLPMEHVFCMMIPETWEQQSLMSSDLRAFYEYHSCLMEPWSGPAAILFCNGKKLGAGLDRNGFRPVRYTETLDGYFIIGSETGMIEIDESNVKEKGRLAPGTIVVVDTEEGLVKHNKELKAELSVSRPFRNWVDSNKVHMDSLPMPAIRPDILTSVRTRQIAFGYTNEEIEKIITPMAVTGAEPSYSMGNDTPLAVLSKKSELLFNYFKQFFAQVTNPTIDSLREAIGMSLQISIGGHSNLLELEPTHCRILELPHPILTHYKLEQLRSDTKSFFRSKTLYTTYTKGESLGDALQRLHKEIEQAVDKGFKIFILSDRNVDENHFPIPSLLAVSSLHNFLIRQGKRGKIGLIVESGEPREVHHIAMLLGYGATAVNPYLVFETLRYLQSKSVLPANLDWQQAQDNYIKALLAGLKKVLSKMGIATLSSYHGSQLFEAIGLSQEVIDQHFQGTTSKLGGITLEQISNETKQRHEQAYSPIQTKDANRLPIGGVYHWRSQGQHHGFNPDTISNLQNAIWQDSYEKFKEFSALVNNTKEQQQTLRDLLTFNTQGRTPIPIEEVEPQEALYQRFITGAMSIGSISKEAHETLAIAMNRLKARSNSGEGGEDPKRFFKDENNDLKRSAIKQVASGRFGVTSEYLANADELQIKIAQGAKPGEGGQLPGHKVTDYIASLRHTTKGVSLISPPPHHDIYSIEDLAQLIFDLKNANPKANINVKLVAQSGIGAVAAGVVKGKANIITISGHDGGTGSSPATSIKHAGVPWEIGLVEAQHTLILNDLRKYVRLQIDGQMKTGYEVIIAGLLGADEFAFSTAPLISLGCIMMRKCHLNTCPVGIATQDPQLRKKFKGKVDHIVRFFQFVAQEVREYMALLGFRTFEELIGRSDLLMPKQIDTNTKAATLDIQKLITPLQSNNRPSYTTRQEDVLGNTATYQLMQEYEQQIKQGKSIQIDHTVSSKDRTFGTLLGYTVSSITDGTKIEEDQIQLDLIGTGGQSLGAFLPKGMSLRIEGDANDYVGKGLSGGKLIVRPPQETRLTSFQNCIGGNAILYGATAGKAFFSGLVGERFAVRNSGAISVVEGIGNHGCEYMTGGIVVVLGPTGMNFGAGMSGGIAYVYDKHRQFAKYCNLATIDIESITRQEDKDSLYQLIQEHYDYTSSKRAKFILDKWKREQDHFVQIVPFEYKKTLLNKKDTLN